MRFMVEEGPQDLILAGEEALLESVARGAEPVLRFVVFKPTAVLVGYHQAVEQEVRVEEVERRGWSIGRRPTGGGTIIMGDMQLGWEIYAPSDALGGTPETAMRLGADGVIRTLREMGIEANFRPKNDVEVKGRKISGIGAFSFGRFTAVTGTILVNFDPEEMVKVLKLSTEKMKDKVAKDFKERLTWVGRELGRNVGMEEIIKPAKEAFSSVLNQTLKDGNYTGEELELLRELRIKYSSREWIFDTRRSLEGQGVVEGERKFQGGLVRVQVKRAGPGLIESVLITGDFFVEPRRAIYDLEARLKWSRLEDVEREVKDWGKEVKILGISPADLSALIREVTSK